MAKVFAKFEDAKNLFESAKTKKGGISYVVGQIYTIPENYEKCLACEMVQGTPVPCLILEQGGTLFLSSVTKRIYQYEYDGTSNTEQTFSPHGEFECVGFVEDNESEVFKLVASCANQLEAVKKLAGKTIEIHAVDEFVSAGGDFVDVNGRTKFVPTKLVKKQLPRFRFVDAPKSGTTTDTDTPENTKGGGKSKK